jgi:epoxyqueuosine reductase
VGAPVDVDALLALGRSAGLDAVGVASAMPFDSTRQHLEARKAAGLHGGMQFTYRNPTRSTTPSASVAGARAIVVGARRYAERDAGELHPPAALAGRAGRVARYAWIDHYAPLRDALRVVARQLKDSGWRAVVFADDNALVDREAAHRAGIGWYGKNTNLLMPGEGSWFVLGSVVTDAPLPVARSPVADGCGSCRRCLDGCPTGAIVAPGVVDANRCLAWLVQRPGTFPVEHREALGDRIYGCDDCQEVCPPNRRRRRQHDDARADATAADATGAWVDLVQILEADDAELLERHGRWYLADRQPRWLRRNALVALGNAGDRDAPAVRAVLARYVDHADALLREHAHWAAGRLGLAELVEGASARVRSGRR